MLEQHLIPRRACAGSSVHFSPPPARVTRWFKKNTEQQGPGGGEGGGTGGKRGGRGEPAAGKQGWLGGGWRERGWPGGNQPSGSGSSWVEDQEVGEPAGSAAEMYQSLGRIHLWWALAPRP